MASAVEDGERCESRIKENGLFSKLRKLARHKLHVRAGSNAYKIMGFLYVYKEANAKEIAERTGVLDVFTDLQSLKRRNFIVRHNDEYSLTKEGKWLVIASRLGLTFLELRILTHAYFLMKTMKNIGCREVFLLSLFMQFRGSHLPGSVRRASYELVALGFLGRLGKGKFAKGKRFGELEPYSRELEELYDWMMDNEEHMNELIRNDPGILQTITRLRGAYWTERCFQVRSGLL